jgi:hypothetical protein
MQIPQITLLQPRQQPRHPADILARKRQLISQLNAIPSKHFKSTGDPAIRFYRERIMIRLEELDWVLPTKPTINA